MRKIRAAILRSKKLAALSATLIAISAASGTVLANSADIKPTQGAFSSLLVLSDNVGDVGREAIHMGLTQFKATHRLDMQFHTIVYVDVDSVKDSAYRQVFDQLKASVNDGNLAVVETSMFDFDRMHNIVATEFPMVDRSSIEDVAVLLRREGGTIKAMRIDPSELAVLGGVEPTSTTAGRARSVADSRQQMKSLGAGYYDPINFAIRAYDADPGTQGNWQLRHNGTYVDVWKTSNGPHCFVAWRGTNPLNPSDDWADVSSQFRTIANIDNGENNTSLKGGRGFVNRLHAYDNTVNDRLRSLGCITVQITGHSLGGAVAQLHGIQLAFNAYFKSRLLAVDAWNSPNVVNTATRALITARFNTLGNLWSVNCRRNDMIVNSVPTGLVRIGPASSAHVAGCTYVSPQRSRNPASNHSPSFWLDELN